ncbi:31-O-demethyl-FK506 methyltransferase FkbM [Halioglobus japonicus]|nr:31-O-demethyl-FK506 methyltransferase FkbM [Halioglobus japonicus]
MNQSTTVGLQIPDLAQPLQLHIHEHDQFVSRRILEDGVWEPYETSLVLKFLRPGDVFVDVGANIGYFSVLGASVVGDQGAVFAFEPDADNFRLLQANAELNKQQHCITAVQGALSDSAGRGQLFLADDNLGDHQVYAGEEERPSVPITLYRGSDFLQSRLQRLDLLKVDTQGSEYHVIAGLMPLLTALQRKPRIIVELTPHSLREAGASGRALIALLATLEQPLWIIDHIEHCLHASTAEELATWCDNWDQVPEARGFMNILVGQVD